MNLLYNTPNQTSKLRTKNWVEIDDDSCGTYSTNSQIKLMLRSSLRDHGDVYILVTGTISVAAAVATATNKNHIKVIFKNCTPFSDSINEINNTKNK